MLLKLKLSNCLVLVVGSVIQAIGIYNIHSLSNVTEGGGLGLTLLLQHWFQISPAVSSLILNLVCYAIGWRLLGKEFIGYSLWPDIALYPLLAAIAGALFIGIGAGLCVRAGGATAGDDALAMSFSHLFRLPIQRIYLISDLAVLLLSLSYIPMQRIAYSLLTVVLSGQIIGLIQKIQPHKK